MSLEKKLQQGLSLLSGRKLSTFPATVVNVDKKQGTCTVTDGSLEYEDVRLSSIIDENENKHFLFPKLNSSVLVEPILEDLTNLHVSAYSEIEEYYLKIENTEFKADNSGILLKHDDENMQKLMLDLIKAIKNMKFTTNTGSTIQLVNRPEFEALEPRIKNLLKNE